MQLGNGSTSQLNVMLEGTQMDCVRCGESTVSKIDMVLEFIQCLSLRGKNQWRKALSREGHML